MGFTNKELRAIFAVAKKNDMVIRLCQKPWVFFMTKEKRRIAMRISDVLAEYDSDKKQEQRNKRYASQSPTTGLVR